MACWGLPSSGGVVDGGDALHGLGKALAVGHVAQGFYNVSGVISTSGRALEWFKNATGKAASDYESLFGEMEGVPAGANRLLFLPYLAGERAPLWDATRRGAFVGLSLEQGRSDMARAAAESLAYGLKIAADLALADEQAAAAPYYQQ